ncbi:acyl carrier protein [candidate division WWE3 bacterium]|uniref:Acyl carrier protein n=1 Tax=candidate division WWE3 bacterium TaxID=2053526 RepID=A0A7X9DKW6_UNCKA|nr:acyl carrier protein [candidate division WWE3 bacterium]
MTGDYHKKVKDVIAAKAGVDLDEIEPESYFEDDLNLSQLELVEILAELEEIFQIELMESKDDIETVQDLFDLVGEQVE